MKLAHEPSHFETIGAVEDTTFKINANGKAFRVLIDGLYSNKIGSIVRELCANAFDAQIVAEESRPFFVHQPNDLRPEFYVRDYGCGMTHDKVMTLYTTIFASDKDESDDLVGAFGLGSKSPFAYADQFFVSCYEGPTEETGLVPPRPGHVRHYSAAIGEDGTPRIVLLEQSVSDEPTGVRVGLTAKPEDFGIFAKEIAATALPYEPLFETNAKLGKVLGDAVLEGNGWRAFKDSGLEDGFSIRQGCVIYPLKATSDFTLPDAGNVKWLIDCPIGKISVTTSREAVAYTPKTLEYLKDRIEALQKDVSDQIWEKVKGITEAAKFFNMVNALCPPFVENDSFTHPVTGLNKPELKLSGASLFDAEFDGERWNYGEYDGITLTRNLRSGTIYLIRDLAPIKDAPDADYSEGRGNSLFNMREFRRFSRLVRAYAADRGTERLQFALQVDLSPKVWKSIYPQAKIVEITHDDLQAAIPKLAKPIKTKTPAIRGLAKCKDGTWTTDPLTKLEGPFVNACWFESDLFRRQPQGCYELAKMFDIKDIYVASETAHQKIIDTGCPNIREIMDSRLPGKLTWYDWLEYYRNHYKLRKTVAIVRAMREHCPEELETILRMKSPLAKAFKAAGSYADHAFAKLDGLPFNVLCTMRPEPTIDRSDGKPKFGTRTISDQAMKIKETVEKVVTFNRSPVNAVLGDMLNCGGNPETLKIQAHVLIATARIPTGNCKFENKALDY